MALYRYIAAAKGDPPHEELIEADSRDEALGKLRSRRMTPVRFCGEVSMASGGGFSLSLSRRNRIDTYEFTRQLTPLLNSYIPLERALGIIAESTEEPSQRALVNSMRQGLHEGKKFSELVRSNGKLFPGYYANLIESGEETGCLPEVMTHLLKFMSESREQRNFIVSSSIYPLAILSVTLIVTVLLFTVFVPKFAKIFTDTGRELPPSMNFLMGLSHFAAWAWWMLPLGGVLVYFLLLRVFGRERLREKLCSILLSVPLFGKILIDLEMSRYIRTLAILIANHVEIIRTVRIAGRIIGNPVIARDFESIGSSLKGGQKLSAALNGNRFIPREMVPMLRIGEESGTVGTMLERIADNLESDTRLKIKRLLSLFEPAVIVFLAAVVLVVVASIFVAMMEMNTIG